jgi:hypothetical protein
LLNELRDDEPLILNTNELVSYCLGTPEEDGIDILDWWRRHSAAYPVLAMMARDIFAVPVSTVPSESCFSSAGRILTDKRTRLGATRFEQLVCLKDWIDAEDRKQHDTNISGLTSPVATQESTTSSRPRSPDEDSDGPLYYEDEDLWYLSNEFMRAF